MTKQETKKVWAVYTNTDLTEGRGLEYVKHLCEIQSTAIRKAHRAGVQGSNASVREVELVKHFNNWYGPVNIEQPTEDDIAEQTKLSIKLDAVKKAKELGLTDDNIVALRL
jgi:Mg-chelatase subunit ChlI